MVPEADSKVKDTRRAENHSSHGLYTDYSRRNEAEGSRSHRRRYKKEKRKMGKEMKWKGYSLKLDTEKDRDIIEYLEARKIKKTICELIRKEINSQEREEK